MTRLLPSFLPLALIPLLAAAAPAGDDPWNQTALGFFKDAHAAFAAQPAADREALLGQAVTLLSLQPKTDANLDRAADLLNRVASSSPDDDFGVTARYYLARIPQVHRVNPDNAAALALFRELAATGSPHPLAQRALVQIALIELFEPRLAPGEIRSRFDSLAARGAALTDPAALRDFHLVMGDAALRFGLGDSDALAHLLAADRAGITRPVTLRDNCIRVAELARRVGKNDVSRQYYTRYLENFPRDARRTLVKERLAALPQ